MGHSLLWAMEIGFEKMSDIENPLRVPKGASSAEAIYLAVGLALSYWEGTQDNILGIYRVLISSGEEGSITKFIEGTRARRAKTLNSLLIKGPSILFADEADKLMTALSELHGLVDARNKIAHGHCSRHRSKTNGIVMVDGFVLSPAFNRGEWIERSTDMSLDDFEINEFTKSVRKIRGVVMDVHHRLALRLQESGKSILMND